MNGISTFIKETPGIPGGPVVKNPPCNAVDMGSTPGWRTNIPPPVEYLSPRDTTTKPVCHSERSCVLQLGPGAVK